MTDTENTQAAFAPTSIPTIPEAPEVAVWGEVTVHLKFPLTVEGATISSITLREPNVEQLEEIEKVSEGKGTFAMLRMTVAILSGIDADALKKLNTRDYMALSEASGPLLEALAASAGDNATT